MNDARLERLIDEAALRRTAELYAQGADRRDKAIWASIMTEDCVIAAPGIESARGAHRSSARSTSWRSCTPRLSTASTTSW